uniref:Uncharacterized protein n=2 Tax=Lotharella globosa TaxID=91324 RepID=A0A7S4E058_9EUKA|mmetsp:Transcript_25000/g.48903  ORF Transcript_25000/g.48903 Transcript_25000/m.48903 type:complete len:189 (+) Transcript_25000:84-650(+)
MIVLAGLKKRGEILKTRYSELLLNLTIVGSILAAFAYDAFESQAEIASEREAEKYFVAFCILSFLCNLVAIIYSLYLWDKVTVVDEEKMLTLVEHFKRILRIPRWLIFLGALFFLVLIMIQGHLDYGEYFDIVFGCAYCWALLVAVGFYLWARRADWSFKEELRIRAKIKYDMNTHNDVTVHMEGRSR